MRRRFLYIGCFLLLANTVFAQQDSVIFINSQKIDPSRYHDVKGSAYFFDEFVLGDIISNEFHTFKDMRLNYNGHTHDFEVTRKDEFIRLDRRLYLRIEIHADQNPAHSNLFQGEKLIFQRGLHSKFYNRFVILLLQGKRIHLVKDFNVLLSESQIQSAGQSDAVKRFSAKHQYYLLKDGEAIALKLKRKKILDAMSHQKELEQYLNRHKLKLGVEEDLLQLFQYYDSLLQP